MYRNKNTTRTPFEMGNVKYQVKNSILNFLSVNTFSCTIYWYMFKQKMILFLASLVGYGQRCTYFWGQHCQSVPLYVELSQSRQIPNFLGQSHQIILSQTQLETYITSAYKEKYLSPFPPFSLSLLNISLVYILYQIAMLCLQIYIYTYKYMCKKYEQ